MGFQIFDQQQATYSTGPYRAATGETDGQLWVPAMGGVGGWTFLVGTWTATRNAGGDYSMNLTAAANSPQAVMDLSQIFSKIGADPSTPATGVRPHAFRGIQPTSFCVCYSLATAALTTHTATLFQTLYVNGQVSSVTTKQAATNLGTATTTNISVVRTAVTTPYIIGNNTDGTADYLELNITNPGTSVYKLYGVIVNFNYNLL